MVDRRQLDGWHAVVAPLVAIVAFGVVTTLSSCGSGGGGGGSNGELCEQCGDTDGPCHQTTTVDGDDADKLCLTGETSCTVGLMCFRKLDSAQRRCFPVPFETPSAPEANFLLFECDGSRPNPITPTPTATPTLTVVNATATPTATATGPTPSATSLTPTPTATESGAAGATPSATATPMPGPTATPVCGNGVVEDDEACDGTQFNVDADGCATDTCTCDDFCDDPNGTLLCTTNCTLDFSQCASGPAGCEAP